MNRFRALLNVAILCSLPVAAPVRAATSNVDQRPVKFGATLPATCWTGDIFFNPNAIAGSNLYACVAPNTWVVQGGGSGGGASNTGQLTDFTDTRVSTVEIDTTLPAGGTRVRAGTAVRSITTTPEKMVGGGSWCAAGGQLWKYVDAATGAVKVDANANVTIANITFTAITAGSNFASGFPTDGSTPVASYTCGNSAANQWDTSPFADWRPFLGNDGFLTGPFTTVTPGARWTLGVDTSKVGNGANATMLVGAVSALSQSAGTPVCDDGNGGVKDTGCSSGGGGGVITDEITYPLVSTSQVQGGYLASGVWTTVSPGGAAVNGGMAGVAFGNSFTDYFVIHKWLPSTWTGVVDVRVHWYQSQGGSGNITWQVSSACFAAGTGNIASPSYNPASTVTTTANVANVITESAVTAIGMVGCSPGNLLWIKVANTGGTYAQGISVTDAVLVTRHN